jgi:hypothetical protein
VEVDDVVFCRHSSHTSDVSKTSDVFWKGEGCLFIEAFHRTRGFPDIGCLADIRCLTKRNSVWVNEMGFGIIISRRGRKIISPLHFPDIGCFENIRCLLARGQERRILKIIKIFFKKNLDI